MTKAFGGVCLKICICDDEQIIHSEIKALLEKQSLIKETLNIVNFSSGEELLDMYSNNGRFDVIFLDIEMGQTDGIETAETIRNFDKNAIIIFVSSHPNYVFEAFRLEALHFLVKPIKESEFNEVFLRALAKHNAQNSFIAFKEGNESYKIAIDDIMYVEHYMRKITIYTQNNTYQLRRKLSEIYIKLESHGFIRVHQGFIVNMNFIKCFKYNEITLENDKVLTISTRKRVQTFKKYNDYLKKWKW